MQKRFCYPHLHICAENAINKISVKRLVLNISFCMVILLYISHRLLCYFREQISVMHAEITKMDHFAFPAVQKMTSKKRTSIQMRRASVSHVILTA